MIDFRLALAQEVAEQIDAAVLPQCCPSCHIPLLMKYDQHVPFCWFCVTDRMAAQRGQTALTKALMAANGVFLQVDLHPHPMADQEDQRSSWPEGMAL